jgi:hypothetical protein
MRKTIVFAAFALLVGWAVSAEATDPSLPAFAKDLAK